ncbi:Hypothetical protein D9617_30g011320 [Elsinoe fawcettii]|nr:Hypothetical protein D9617_30g011320 [Elsinoe fawcettii]
MRSSLAYAVVSLIFSNALTSYAAPAPSVSQAAHWDFRQDQGDSLAESVDHTGRVEEIQLLETIIPLTRKDVNQAVVVASCQGCSVGGADVYPVFDFKVEPNSVEECAVAFTLNGSTTRLSRSSPTSTVTVLSSKLDAYVLRTELTCGFDKHTGSLIQAPVISVYIESVDGRKVPIVTGFRAHPSPEAFISKLSRFHSVNPDKVSYANPPLSISSQSFERVDLHDNVVVDVSQVTDSSKSDHSAKDCQYRCPLHAFLARLQTGDKFEHFKSRVQSVMIDAKNSITSCLKHKDDKSEEAKTQPENRVSTTKSGSVESSRESLRRLVDTQTPLIIALEALASALGLGGFLFFLRTRCCSLRRRVERLADREERMKAREYRRAARKEAWRKRWASVKRTCTCCFGGYERESEDEEKQGLVSHGAEDGVSGDLETSMAQYEGLQYAHEIIAQMILNKRHESGTTRSSALGYPVDVACHYANSRQTRSRASSLPSYNSDVLPDYSSQPDSAEIARHVRVVNNYRRSGSPVSSTGSSRCTPYSSIPDISPRPSQETLRTQSER